MAQVERVVWDTNVAISLLQNEQGRLQRIEPYIEKAEAGRLEILFPETSVVELHNLRGLQDEGKDIDEIRAIIRDFLDQPYLLRRPLHRRLANLASELALVHRIKRAADAVVLALTRQESVATLHTYDHGLIQLSGKVGVPPITICEPDPATGTLFADDAHG
jgi:predicted nucleic acid-binding protein